MQSRRRAVLPFQFPFRGEGPESGMSLRRSATLRSFAQQPTRCGRPRTGSGRSGISMVELLVTVAILLVAILNSVAAAVSSSALRSSTAEYVKAHNASRAVLE